MDWTVHMYYASNGISVFLRFGQIPSYRYPPDDSARIREV